MPNWVDKTEHTDQDADSTGCGMAFLSWLISRGHGLSAVAQTMVRLGDNGTLARLYGQLTGDAASSAWSNFSAAVRGLPGGVISDDPFGALATAGAAAEPPGQHRHKRQRPGRWRPWVSCWPAPASPAGSSSSAATTSGVAAAESSWIS
jgi:hypothetical protein